jgi:alkylhydroperoxidase family enzyme
MKDPAWIETVPETDWDKDTYLSVLLEKVKDKENGRVDNIMAVHSINPKSLEAHNALYSSAMSGTASLRKVERELIAFVVSLENNCHY